MGSIIDKLNRTKSVIEALCAQLNKSLESYVSYKKCYSLKDIENIIGVIYVLGITTTALSSDVRKGKTYYRDNGDLLFGSWEPYSGSTVTASDILSGKKAYDSNGILLTGTCVASGSSSTSTKPYKLTVCNRCTELKIVKGFSGPNNNLTPSYCLAGENYDIYVDLGDVVTFIFYDSKPNSVTVSSPLADLVINAPSVLYSGTTYNIPSWSSGKMVYATTYLFYYGANNTSITFK